MLDLFNVLGDACESSLGAQVPAVFYNMVHYIYLGIQIVVPILLIIFGMIELAKAITAQKEEEIKKAQGGLVKKAVVAIIVFLVFSLVQFIFNFASTGKETEKKNVWDCVNCFIKGNGVDSCNGSD